MMEREREKVMSPWPLHTTLLIDWLPVPGLNPFPRASGFIRPSSTHTQTHTQVSPAFALNRSPKYTMLTFSVWWQIQYRVSCKHEVSLYTVRWLDKVRAYCCWRTHILMCVNFKCSNQTVEYIRYVVSSVNIGCNIWCVCSHTFAV